MLFGKRGNGDSQSQPHTAQQTGIPMAGGGTMNMAPLYDPESVRPMWEELAFVGVKPVHSAEEVDQILSQKDGTVLVVVNSVCGCAAGGARPGVALGLQHTTIPDTMVTVFAGVDRAAVQRARERMPQIEPSSPCIALFKNGELVHAIERRHIETMGVAEIAEEMKRAFDTHCAAKGPSISSEQFEKYVSVKQCGSTIPSFQG